MTTTTTTKRNATIAPMGMLFPVPFTIVSVNPVRPIMKIRETFAGEVFTRSVRFSVFRHAARVHGVRIVGAK
jgi:hypothetical protein